MENKGIEKLNILSMDINIIIENQRFKKNQFRNNDINLCFQHENKCISDESEKITGCIDMILVS